VFARIFTRHPTWKLEKEHRVMWHSFQPSTRVKQLARSPFTWRSCSILLALLVVFSFVLAACGGGSSSGSSGPVTLTFGWWSNTPAKDNAMKAWIADFESSHPNIKIKPEILPWGNYWDKLKTTTAGGNAYDIIGMCSCMAGPYYDSGSLVDLSTISDYQSVAQTLTPQTLKLTNWSGKPLGVPIGTSVSLLGYNKNLLNAAGVPLPDPAKPMTFDQFKAIAAKITKVGTQYALNPSDILDYDAFVRLEGGSTYDNYNNPTKVTIDTPAGIQGLTDYLSLFTQHIAPPYDQLTNGPWSFDLGALETNKIGFARVGAWLFSDIQSSASYIATTPLFCIKQCVLPTTVNSLAIYSGSKNQAAAWEFLKWATQVQPEISFAKFSDIPANTEALSQMSTYITPKEFVPSLQAALPTVVPIVITAKQQLTTTLSDSITDLVHGKLTPAQAAAQMQQQGNSILSGS
jgi:multiple sugar transport system substrate-binding protein